MLDDHRRKAVAAIGDFGHRASLPSASFPSYPVTLTKPRAQQPMVELVVMLIFFVVLVALVDLPADLARR